jgi:hypothetical protein
MKKILAGKILGVIIVFLFCTKTEAQLKISADKLYLVTTSGKPFFLAGRHSMGIISPS